MRMREKEQRKNKNGSRTSHYGDNSPFQGMGSCAFSEVGF